MQKQLRTPMIAEAMLTGGKKSKTTADF